MSDPQPLRNYADLATARRRLSLTASDDDVDADLLLCAQAVTAEIEDGLGVVWDGTPVANKSASRSMAVRFGAVRLRPPAYAVTGVSQGGLDAPVVSGPVDATRGWVSRLLLATPACVDATALVTARWADDPGGDPPPAVRLFATTATCQYWRFLDAGGSSQTGPDGVTQTISSAWKANGEWDRLVAAYRLPDYTPQAMWVEVGR